MEIEQPHPPSPAPKPTPRPRSLTWLCVLLPLLGYLAEAGTGLFEEVAFDPFPGAAFHLLAGGGLLAGLLVTLHANNAYPGVRVATVANGYLMASSLLWSLWFLFALAQILVGLLLGLVLGLLALAPFWSLLGSLLAIPFLSRGWRALGEKGSGLVAHLGVGALLFAIPFVAHEWHESRSVQLLLQAVHGDRETAADALRTLRGGDIDAMVARLRYVPVESRDFDLFDTGFGGSSGRVFKPWIWRPSSSRWSHGSNDPEHWNMRQRLHLLTGATNPEIDRAWHQRGFGSRRPAHPPKWQSGRLGSTNLELTSWTLDGRLEKNTAALAFVSLQLRFHNQQSWQAEARLQLQLPPGARASQLSLWVNGVESQAAFSSRERVERAYDDIAKVQRKDPALLIELPGGRVDLRVFPVPGNGSQTVRMGFVVPLLPRGDHALLQLPRLVDGNFRLAHGLLPTITMPGLHEPQVDLLQPTVLKLTWQPIGRRAQARTKSRVVVQQLASRERDPAAASQPVVFVIDGSQELAPHKAEIARSFMQWGRERPCMVVFAGLETSIIEGTCGDEKLSRWLLAKDFGGGVDASGAMSAALQRAANASRDQQPWIVYLHGSQPVQFSGVGAAADLYASLNRARRNLHLATLRVAGAGRNLLLESIVARLPRTWCPAPRSEDLREDLARLAQVPGLPPEAETPAFATHRRIFATPSEALTTDVKEVSDNLCRLWASQEYDSLMRSGSRKNAVPIALDHRLVTPLTGAVVLETRAHYEKHDLDPDAEAEVLAEPGDPVPEPSTWLLLGTGLALLLLYRLKRRGGGPPAPLPAPS